MVEFTPEKSKQIALARLDVIHKWLEFRKKSQNKLQADYDFVKLHNTSSSHLFGCKSKLIKIFISSSFRTVRYSRTVAYLY